MGVGIWSMHFIGMLAFSVKGLDIYYDVPLMLLSILVAVLASALALHIVGSREPDKKTYIAGSLIMGAAIAGMHYIGIWSMRMNATINWDTNLVIASIFIAITASYGALLIAFKLRNDLTLKGFLYRGLGGMVMGIAIAGMHYTAMMAMHLTNDPSKMVTVENGVLATDGLAAAVIVGTIFILGIALSGSNVERALSKKTVINEALQASIKMWDEFFSIASHELKTPLTSIKLLNDLLQRSMKAGSLDEAKLKSMLEKSGRNIDRINHLVSDMLDISRISGGKLKLQKEEFDLVELVSEVVETLKPLMDEADCRTSLEHNGPAIGNWDRFRLEQVITNILTNAAKYASGAPVDISIESDSKIVKLKIKDHGKGIPLDDQSRIFKRFERAGKEGDSRGLGLGLFITREILLMHNGSIEVESRPNEGANFIICLPLKFA